jgi:hypothetical protein
MPDLTVVALDRAELSFVWPLVRAGGYDLGLEGWLIDGRALIARGGAVLAVRGGDGTFYGAATCEAIEQRGVRILKVDTFVACEVSRGAPVRRALTDGVEQFGEELGCAGIAVAGPNAPFLKEQRKRRALHPNARSDARVAAGPPFR